MKYFSLKRLCFILILCMFSCKTNPNYNVTGVILEKDFDKEFLGLIMIEFLALWNL